MNNKISQHGSCYLHSRDYKESEVGLMVTGRNIPRVTTVVMRVFVALVLVTVFHSEAGADLATTATLSVEETVEAVKQGSFDRLNMHAKSELIRMLHDPAEMKYWYNIVSVLGGRGTSEDIDDLVSMLKNVPSTAADPSVRRIHSRVMEALATMGKRGILEARIELRRMADPEYWEKYDLRIIQPVAEYHVNEQTYMASAALAIYSLSADPEFPEQAMQIIQKIKNDRSRKFMESELPGYLENHRQMTEAIKSGNPEKYFSDLLKGKKRAPTRAKRPSKREYAKLLESREARVHLTTSTSSLALQKEAIAAFNLMADALREDNLAYVVQHIADDGRPVLVADEVSSSSVKALLDETDLIKALADQKELLADATLTVPDTPVRWILGYRFADSTAVPSAPPSQDPRLSYDLIVVHLAAPGLQHLKQESPRFFRNHPTPFPETLAESTPVVTMVWQSGQWYWNPFGW